MCDSPLLELLKFAIIMTMTRQKDLSGRDLVTAVTLAGVDSKGCQRSFIIPLSTQVIMQCTESVRRISSQRGSRDDGRHDDLNTRRRVK